MAVKLQTFNDINKYLAAELSSIYSEQEIKSIVNILVSRIFRIDRLSLLLNGDEPVPDSKEAVLLKQYCRKLKSGWPVQYVTGETLFYNCVIKVSRGVLIPRPETEELVDLIVRENSGFTGKIVDFGTGSGCIAIALARSLPSATIIGTDISDTAIKIASGNAALNKADVLFLKSDIFGIPPTEVQNADIFISNPPYVRYSEKIVMRRNVLDFEPSGALFVADDDPLRFYRAILAVAEKNLNSGGVAYFEINEAFGELMIELLQLFDFRNTLIIKDLSGKDRFVKGIKNG